MKSLMRSLLPSTAAAVSMLLVSWSCQSGGEAPPPSTPAESEGSQAPAENNPAATESAATPNAGAAAEHGDAAVPADGVAAQPTAAPVTCKDGDTVRQVGESWAVACNTCRCTESGEMACTLKHCDE